MMSPTKTDQTKVAYEKRAKSLLIRFASEKNYEWHDNFEIFQTWLKDLQKDLKKASWRQYKASLIYYFEITRVDENQIRVIKRMGTTGCKKKSSNTSANKRKTISTYEIDELDDYFRAGGRNKWDNLTMQWLQVGILTGLRPQEWEHARVELQTLIVRNAKNTNGRSFATERILDLSQLDLETIDDIETFIALLRRAIKSEEGGFTAVYEACRHRLRRATRKLWPKREKYPTLYSARHQFSANAKKVFSLREVAALMGHKTDETATEHYGKRVDGVDLPAYVVPDPEQVKLIIEKNKLKRKSGLKFKKSSRI